MNEQIKRFDELYAKMSQSTNVEDMKVFGKVMREAIKFIAENAPAKSEEMIEKLEAINYKNFLTKKEADEIIASMEPAPEWTIEQIKRALVATGAPTEEKPCYNECALVTTIAMIASDSKETLEKYAGATDGSKLLELCYHLALDKLKDKDGVFSIRRYFEL